MKKLLSTLLLLTLLSSSFLLAQEASREAIRVDRVDFNSVSGDWIQMAIELSCLGNPSPEARNSRFVEDIEVKVYLAWERDAQAREYDYYVSDVEIIIMEQGDDNNVYFYLPGLIVERDRLNTDPDFHYVEISVGGEEQAPQPSAMHRDIKSLEILESFTSNADAGSTENEHFLMPIYLVSGIDLGRVSDLPVFLRREVRQ